MVTCSKIELCCKWQSSFPMNFRGLDFSLTLLSLLSAEVLGSCKTEQAEELIQVANEKVAIVAFSNCIAEMLRTASSGSNEICMCVFLRYMCTDGSNLQNNVGCCMCGINSSMFFLY